MEARTASKQKCERCGLLKDLTYHEGIKMWLCEWCLGWICPECGREEMSSFEKNNIGRCSYCNYGSMGEEH